MSTRNTTVRRSKTTIDDLLDCVGRALKKEKMKFTEDDRRKFACILISLAHRINSEVYKSIKPWPEAS